MNSETKTKEKIETKKFDAEVGKVLQLMIHSLYTNKEIFIRELISNASDACDKLRYMSISNESLISDDSNFKIVVSIDKDAKTITIKDNGIGMTKEEMASNLGTIAKSGTQSFLNQMSDDNKKISDLIGQFGVGFYSAFMAGDYVSVMSTSAIDKTCSVWESDGMGEYKISEYTEDDLESRKKSRGTEIVVHLKKDSEGSFLDHFIIKNIIKSYSDHISVPIFYYDSEAKTETQVNSGSALWTRNKSEITESEYQDFYKNVSHSGDKPFMMMHNRNEGVVEFTNLLFAPTQKTYDLFHPDRRRRVKLYIKKVFITDENVELIPRYLRFLRGVIDCQDLPLNISRETLQHNKVIDKIRNSITTRFFSELKKKKAEGFEEYVEFWKAFGPAIKEGLCEHLPSKEHESIMEACLFKSALNGKYISFDDYIDKLKAKKETEETNKDELRSEDKDKDEDKIIYYIGGEKEDQILKSPQLESFLERGIDVLMFTDNVDDFFVNVVSEYKGFELKSITRADNKIDANKDTQEKDKSSDELCGYFKQVLGSSVKDVVISDKMTSSPVCLSIPQMGMDSRLEKLLLEQGQIKTSTPKILELNPKNKIIQKIKNDLALNVKNDNLVKLLFAEAVILFGEQLSDAAEFSKILNELIEEHIV